METGDALPPEIYRLDARRLPWAKGAARRRVSVAIAFAAGAATWLAARDDTTLRAALDEALGVVALAAAVAGYALWAAGRRVRRSWNGFELGIGPHSLRVAGPGFPRATVSRVEVVRIVERASGLTVRTSAPGVRARVPRDIEAYRDVRARLGTWGPIVRRPDLRAAAAVVLVAVACAGCAYLAVTASAPAAITAGAVFVTAVGLLAIVDVALRPAWAPTVKVVIALLIGAGVFALLANVLGRAG